MNKSIDDFTDSQREKETKKIFKIAVDYLKLNSAEIEKSRELFAEYLKWNKSEWDVNTIVYEKIGDAYSKYSKNNDRFKSEAEVNYKIAFNYFFENKDKTDLLAETYRYSLAEYYLKGIGTTVSREKSYEMFESWYEYISKKSLEYNRKVSFSEVEKIYRYVQSLYSPDQYIASAVKFGADINLEELRFWLKKILEIHPTHRDAKRAIEVVDLYISKPKLFEIAKRRKKEIDADEIIFNKIKDCVTKKPPDFDQAYKIYTENNSDEFSSEVLNLEYLGKIYLRIAQKENPILIAEAEKLHKSAFNLCQKENMGDFGSSYTRARFHLEGIGTERSFTRHQGTLTISFRFMKEDTDKEKELKATRAYQIANTYQKKDLNGRIVDGAKEDLKLAMTWMLKAKSLGAGNRLSKFDEKFEELEQKISSKNLEHASKNKSNEKTDIARWLTHFDYNGKQARPSPIMAYPSHHFYDLVVNHEKAMNSLFHQISDFFKLKRKGLLSKEYVNLTISEVGTHMLGGMTHGLRTKPILADLKKFDWDDIFFDKNFYLLIGCGIINKNNITYLIAPEAVILEEIKFFEENNRWKYKENTLLALGERENTGQYNKFSENFNKKNFSAKEEDKLLNEDKKKSADTEWAKDEFLKDMENRKKLGKSTTLHTVPSKPKNIKSIEDREGITIELIKSILMKGGFQYRDTQGFIEDCLKMRKGGFFKKAQPAPTLNQLKSLFIQYNPRIEVQFPGHANVIFSKEIVEYLGFDVDSNNQVYKK